MRAEHVKPEIHPVTQRAQHRSATPPESPRHMSTFPHVSYPDARGAQGEARGTFQVRVCVLIPLIWYRLTLITIRTLNVFSYYSVVWNQHKNCIKYGFVCLAH